MRDSIAELNLSFAMLAALSRETACVCKVTRRVKTSSAAFLPLPQKRLEYGLNSLCDKGLLQFETNGDCPERCERRYCLTSQGQYALGDFLGQLRTWGIGAPSEVRSVQG
jgi:hypothetical protein